MAERRGRWSDPDVFKAFRENFKPATKSPGQSLLRRQFLAVDGLCCARMSENIFLTLLTAVLIGAAVLYGIILLYAFPLLAVLV